MADSTLDVHERLAPFWEPAHLASAPHDLTYLRTFRDTHGDVTIGNASALMEAVRESNKTARSKLAAALGLPLKNEDGSACLSADLEKIIAKAIEASRDRAVIAAAVRAAAAAAAPPPSGSTDAPASVQGGAEPVAPPTDRASQRGIPGDVAGSAPAAVGATPSPSPAPTSGNASAELGATPAPSPAPANGGAGGGDSPLRLEDIMRSFVQAIASVQAKPDTKPSKSKFPTLLEVEGLAAEGTPAEVPKGTYMHVRYVGSDHADPAEFAGSLAMGTISRTARFAQLGGVFNPSILAHLSDNSVTATLARLHQALMTSRGLDLFAQLTFGSTTAAIEIYGILQTPGNTYWVTYGTGAASTITMFPRQRDSSPFLAAAAAMVDVLQLTATAIGLHHADGAARPPPLPVAFVNEVAGVARALATNPVFVGRTPADVQVAADLWAKDCLLRAFERARDTARQVCADGPTTPPTMRDVATVVDALGSWSEGDIACGSNAMTLAALAGIAGGEATSPPPKDAKAGKGGGERGTSRTSASTRSPANLPFVRASLPDGGFRLSRLHWDLTAALKKELKPPPPPEGHELILYGGAHLCLKHLMHQCKKESGTCLYTHSDDIPTALKSLTVASKATADLPS